MKAADEKLEQLSKDKLKLENDISEMMKASGDSSVQLTKMNEDLIQKERYHVLSFFFLVCHLFCCSLKYANMATRGIVINTVCKCIV